MDTVVNKVIVYFKDHVEIFDSTISRVFDDECVLYRPHTPSHTWFPFRRIPGNFKWYFDDKDGANKIIDHVVVSN